jgi:hypothetical protein
VPYELSEDEDDDDRSGRYGWMAAASLAGVIDCSHT